MTHQAEIKRERMRIWGNALWFNVLWFALVLGAAAQNLTYGWAALLVLLVWAAVYSNNFRNDLRMAIAGVVVALVVEPVWLAGGLITYPTQSAYNLPPNWIVALWAGFALSFNHCLYWLQSRLTVALVLGGVGSLFSVTSAARLGAVEFPEGWPPMAITYGLIWALITPLLAWLASRYAHEAEEQAATQARQASEDTEGQH